MNNIDNWLDEVLDDLLELKLDPKDITIDPKLYCKTRILAKIKEIELEARRQEWRYYSEDALMRHFAITYEQLKQGYWSWIGAFRKYRQSELQTPQDTIETRCEHGCIYVCRVCGIVQDSVGQESEEK